jgi:hypothetical protein
MKSRLPSQVQHVCSVRDELGVAPNGHICVFATMVVELTR